MCFLNIYFRLMPTCVGPVEVCVCIGYGTLSLAKRGEPGYPVRIVLPESKWYSSVKKKKKKEKKSA